MAGEMVADARTGRNGRHALVGMLRQSVFGRLAGYEDVNDAQRLRHDPAMQWIVGGKAASDCAASPSQMGRFETKWLAAEKNLFPLAHLSGQWIDRAHDPPAPRGILLAGTATTTAPAIIRCSCSTNLAIWNAAPCVRATFTAPTGGKRC